MNHGDVGDRRRGFSHDANDVTPPGDVGRHCKLNL